MLNWDESIDTETEQTVERMSSFDLFLVRMHLQWPKANTKILLIIAVTRYVLQVLLTFIAKYDVPIENGLFYIQHCGAVSEQNSIVNSVPVDNWTGELAIIFS